MLYTLASPSSLRLMGRAVGPTMTLVDTPVALAQATMVDQHGMLLAIMKGGAESDLDKALDNAMLAVPVFVFGSFLLFVIASAISSLIQGLTGSKRKGNFD